MALTCSKTPVNPYDPSNTRFSLAIEGTHLTPISNVSFSDTLGDSIRIGTVTYLSNNIDSARISVVSSHSLLDTFFTLTAFDSLNVSDTVWRSFLPGDTGTAAIKAQAFIGNRTLFSDSISLRILPKANRHKPWLSISGKTAVESGELCSLFVSANDSDGAQTFAYSVTDTPKTSSFIQQVFKWTPPLDYTGTDTVIFMVSDNGFPPLADTQKIAIAVSNQIDTVNQPPKWEKDTLNQACWRGTVMNLTLRDKCADPEKDSLKFSLLPGTPANDTIRAGIYSFLPTAKDSGTLYPRIIARDPEGLEDTVTMKLMIKTVDTIAPIMKLLSPAQDSASVSSNSVPVRLLCKDESDVASVSCALGPDSFSVSRSDSIFTAVVTGLKPGVMNKIKCIAMDASPRANKDTLFFFIKYDSTIADNVPPALRIVNPGKDTVINVDSCALQMICKDASGISSITCATVGNSVAAVQSAKADSIFTATIKGLRGGQWTNVVISAFDKSAVFNKCSLTVRIKYDNDSTPPAIRLSSPAKDSSLVAGNSTTLNVICKDASGVSALSCAIGNVQFSPQKSAMADSMWSVNIMGLVAGQFTPVTFIAADSSLKANKDTFTIYVKYDSDTIPPTLALNTPVKDSISINSGSYLVKVVCKDASGVAAMLCSTNGTSVAAIHNPGDSIWQANATGLTAGQFNTITCIAVDSSVRANRDTLAFCIKYDPTMLDSFGPMFIRVSGPVSGDVVTDSIIAIADSIVDPSGVDSVYWTLNGIRAGMLTAGADGMYLLKDTLTKFHSDTIVIYAQDKSTLINRSSSVIVVDYNVPPLLNDTSVTTNRNTALSLTLHAVSADGDPVVWTVLSAPSASSGSLSGALPAITFTPAANWAGADSFRVKVTDGILSDTAKVKITVSDVPVPPKNVVIISQPASDTVILGQGINFSVSMNSDVNPAPTYQWNHGEISIPGAQSSTYSISGAALKDTGTYSVSVTNSVGSATSPSVVLVILVPPSITVSPESQTKCNGESVSFSVTASGSQPYTYQWKKDGVTISGTNTPTYTIPSVSSSNVGVYTCFVTNICGAGAGVTSQGAALTVNTPPSIRTQPVSQTKWAGDSVEFSVVASGTAPFTYQWKKGTAVISGANSATYKINGINYSTDNGAAFSCVVTNGCTGVSATSNAATLTVNAVKAASGGYGFSIFLRTDNTLWSCGYNYYGQLGLGDTINHPAPRQITGITNPLSIEAGLYHSLILRNDGVVFICGNNAYGYLGLGDSTHRKTPVQISSLSSIQRISGGMYFSVFQRSNGALYTSGYNSYGQIGDGSLSTRLAPYLAVTDGVTAIAAANYHVFYLKGTTLYGMGSNSNKELGDGGTAASPVKLPLQIMTGVSSMCGGAHFSLILKGSTLYSVGDNPYGQLGDGTKIDKDNPVQIMTGVSKIAAGRYHSVILKTDGTVWTCGLNMYGQIGNGSTLDQSTPVQVMSNVSSIAAGAYHSYAIKTDGSLWAWGFNNYGNLADGTTTDRSTPVQIKW